MKIKLTSAKPDANASSLGLAELGNILKILEIFGQQLFQSHQTNLLKCSKQRRTLKLCMEWNMVWYGITAWTLGLFTCR